MAFVLLSAMNVWGQPPSEPQKKLIAWGGLDWYSPASVANNIRKIEELPFDGTVLQGFKAHKDGQEVQFDWLSFGQEKFEREHLVQTIEILKAIDFQRFTDNFLRYNTYPGGVDWFDDFDAILHNAQLWAQIANETGMKGWMFDVEDHDERIFAYGNQKYVDQKTFDEYAHQARLRGRQFMEAVQDGYPDIVIMLSHAHSYVNIEVSAGEPLHDVQYNLLPAFLNGMIEAAGPQVRLVDGHEQGYRYLTAQDYSQAKHKMQQGALALVPPQLHDKYRHTMHVGMPVWANLQLATYNRPGGWVSYYMAPEDRLRLFEQNVYNALMTVDEYAWIYSEHMNWREAGSPAPTPDGAIDAMRSARDKVRCNEPLGFDLAETLATAKLKLHEKSSGPWPTRQVTVPRVPEGQVPPKIDGVLDDAMWNDGTPLEDFVPFVSSNTKQAQVATFAHVAFDDAHLYIAFHCSEPQPDQLVSHGEKKDDGIWKGDCVEVFLDVSEDMEPFHFIVDSRNIQWDGKGTSDWDASWRSKTHVGGLAWTVEIEIPWAVIGGRPHPGATLRANLARHRGSGTDHTTWSPMFENNLEPQRFGHWEFVK